MINIVTQQEVNCNHWCGCGVCRALDSASYICEMVNSAMKKLSLIVDTQAKPGESHFQNKTETNILKGRQITVLKEYGHTNIR